MLQSTKHRQLLLGERNFRKFNNSFSDDKEISKLSKSLKGMRPGQYFKSDKKVKFGKTLSFGSSRDRI